MASTFEQLVRASSSNLSLRELLEEPVTELLGIGQGAATALQAIGVKTIFDLGSSAVFAQASSALAVGSGLRMLPSDLLDDGAAETAVDAVPDLPIESLRGIGSATAKALSDTLDVTTIRDLALWPPRRVAHDMVSAAAGTNLGQSEDDAAEELRPNLGEYPTERVYYDTLVMLGSQPLPNQTPLTKPLSLGPLAAVAMGFGAPAIGAVATYSQSWFAQGVTLGHMVHSLALAPGEATRVAVIDFRRTSRVSATESVEEREQLDQATSHSRAASEVQNAVAQELQSGGSIATGWAKSTSDADNFSASLGGGIAGMYQGVAGVLGFGIGGSTASQESETNSKATSTSWSIGSKSVMAEMTQRVNDRTEQHATSVRNRRATAVREVSETEHQQVSTRIVANYNHMHALTVQYYEVVQIYRVAVKLNNFVRALFLPFELLDFSAPDAADIVARFRGQLLAAALTERAAQLLIDDRGRIEVRTAIRVPRPLLVDVRSNANVSLGGARMAMMAAGPSGAAVSPGGSTTEPHPAPTGDASTLPGPVRLTVVRAGPVAEILPGDAKLVSVSFEDVGVDRLQIGQTGVAAEASTFVVPPATDQVDFATPIPIRSIESINVARDDSVPSVGSMVIRYEADSHVSIAVVPLALAEGTRMQKVAFLSGDAADRRAELLAHLQANRGYYTRAVLARLDSASLVLLLSDVSWLGKPLADQVEPNPIAVTGNYLVLRAPAEDLDLSGMDDTQTWEQLLEDRGIDLTKQDTRLVPIPTGGVFAEAVLGRSNSAEKLDITRFWNWQDSPIPLQPPEIAPVGTGSRATSQDLLPGQLGAPVLNIVQPTPLPEPAGLSAALGALAAGNMFRDMSGLAGTQAAAQAAAAGTLSAATEAGRIASANYQAATNQATEMGKAAADMWKVMKGKDGSGGGQSGGGNGGGSTSSGGVSTEGARINHGRDMDERGVSSGAASSGTAGGPSVTEYQPEFAGSRSKSPVRPRYSHEEMYSDEGVAVSPDMIGRTVEALGKAVAEDVASALEVIGIDLRGTLAEQAMLAVIRGAAEQAGFSMTDIELIPMRLHDNNVEFSAVEFTFWCQSSKRIYVNLPWFHSWLTFRKGQGWTDKAAMNDVRGLAVVGLQHELIHASDFKTNQDSPPDDFKEMIKFEERAYGSTSTWIKKPATKKLLKDVIGANPATITALSAGLSKSHTWFKTRLGLTSAAARKDLTTVVAPGETTTKLPTSIKGEPDYAIEALYQTKEP